MSVNVPTNQTIKEKDVNGKLQLYGIYAAFANGKVPSNKQIDVALNTALEWNQLKSPSKKLSAEGQLLVQDLRRVIEQSKILLLSKNDGNLLQDFIWQTQMIGKGNASSPNAPLDKDTAKQHGQQALEGLRTLGELLITNGQFRKLLSDAVVLLRDIAGDAASKAADRVNPSEEQLNRLDHPAPDNTWHEKPDLSKDNLSSRIKSNLPIGKKDLQDAAGNATQAADPSGSRDPADVANKAAADQQTGGASGVNAVGGAKAGAQDLKNKLSANTDEDQKQRAREYRERTNTYFKEKVPKERREQIIYRLKKMVVEVQGHQDYRQAIDTLLRLAEEYTGHTKNVAGQSQDAVKGAHDQDSLQIAEADLKTLLERFANSTSFDDLFDSVNQIYRDSDNDPELKGWFKDIDRYIRRCLQEQGYILEDDSNEQWNRLYDRGNFLLREKYRGHTDRIVDELKFLAGEFDRDPQIKAFADAMNKLFQDLGNDENGKPTFKPHLLKDLSGVIIPGFFEHVRYVPIPRIEVSDSQIDAIVENLVLEGDNLAPNLFEFGSDNYWRWGRKSIQNKNKNKVMLSVSGIQADLRDVSYYIKRKQGFPSITDKGVMDLFLGGTGFSFKVAMETADKSDKQHFFKINTVSVDVKNLNIKLKQSNHKLLFGLFKPLLLKVMRPVLQKVIEKQIRDNVHKADAFLYQVKREADRAAEEAKSNPDPENIQNMYQRYFTAFQQQLQKGKKKTEEKTSDTQVNVAVTQHDSIFKNIALPGGISTKATEYKELAAKGEKWESPVFSIGSAKETSNLPSVSHPQRKRHDGSSVTGAGSGNMGTAGLTGNTGSTGTSGLTGTSGSAMAGANGGFSSEVNNAFDNSTTDSTTGGLAGGLLSNGPVGQGTSAPGSTTLGSGSTHTTLGSNNPVFQGRV